MYVASMYVTSSLFATVLFATVLKLSCTSETIFIKTNSSSDHQCPAEPCLTLQKFVSHHYRVESNTVLKFLPGKHMLQFTAGRNISIINVVNVTLTGVSGQQSSVIHCMSEFSISAKNATNLTISNLSFSGCGGPLPKSVITDGESVFRPASLFLLFVSNTSVLNTHIHDSKGTGMIVVNGFGLTVNQTSFVGNVLNCVIMFLDGLNTPVKQAVSSYIASSEFAFGGLKSLLYAGGLSLIFTQTSYTVYVKITNIALHNNTGIQHSNFLMSIDKLSCRYTMVRAEKVKSNSGFEHLGPGVSVEEYTYNSVIPHQRNHSQKSEYTVHILDSSFVADTGTAVEVRTYQSNQLSNNMRVKFTDISIAGNEKVGMCYGMSISNLHSVVLERVNISNYEFFSSIRVTNSEITIDNAFILKNGGFGGIVSLWKSQITFVGNTVFAQNYEQRTNRPGAIYAYSSTLIFQGNVEFVNNTGYYGGALALFAGSQIVIGRDAHLKFIGNHAKHFGGAIYVDNYVFTDIPAILSFYKLADPFNTSMNPHVVFENNTADYAGSALYGGYIDFCVVNDLARPIQVKSDFDSLFQVNGGESDYSLISSNPLRVCLCIDSRPDCSITQYNSMVYPGTTIQLPAVAAGQRFGTVPSIIYSDFCYKFEQLFIIYSDFCYKFEQMNGTKPSINDWQSTQKVEKHCTTLTYTIKSPSQVVLAMILKVENLADSGRDILEAGGKLNKLTDPGLYLTNLLINIEMLPCPMGFQYHNTSMTCMCDSKLVEYGMNCSIDTQTVWRKNPFWITTAEETSELLVHKHCPFDYCKPDSFDLDLEDPDKQCTFNRTGVLCGACQNNLSHVFGTSACRECSSLWILLWVPVIGLAGIALVVLLIVLNLTVSVGTINGLIFYANIVRANHATFFPPNTTNSFLSWFIAWINLDLGIETCFYNGLDAYVKTWLQFVFPLYIWFLVIMIIVLSHYFTLAARLSGRNAVPVLATLFLLSYAKLLRIIITVFQSTDLEYSDNIVRKIWFYDGNVDYLKGKHIPLFIAALLLLLISLPYTAILIFIQYLQHWSSYRVLFWVKKLKPLFDAYTGPYKDKHRYWTGLLLLVRIVLFLIFSLNIRGSANINLLAISVTVLLLFMHLSVSGGVYKTWHLNIIEYSFFLNLGVLSSATFYTTVSGRGQTAVAYTSVSIAFVLFIIIVVFHILTKLKFSQHYNWSSVNTVRKLRVKLSKLRSVLKKPCCKERSPLHNTQPRVTHATVELRESLLEYCSQ